MDKIEISFNEFEEKWSSMPCTVNIYCNLDTSYLTMNSLNSLDNIEIHFSTTFPGKCYIYHYIRNIK